MIINNFTEDPCAQKLCQRKLNSLNTYLHRFCATDATALFITMPLTIKGNTYFSLRHLWIEYIHDKMQIYADFLNFRPNQNRVTCGNAFGDKYIDSNRVNRHSFIQREVVKTLFSGQRRPMFSLNHEGYK